MDRTASQDPGQNSNSDLLRRLEELNEIGISLSREKSLERLLESILVAAKKITNADGGTLYRRHAAL
jgi:GAF domain-containing protein